MGLSVVLEYIWLAFSLAFEVIINPIRALIRYGYCKSNARLDGKVAIVTGANSGIGLATAKHLAERGATVIMACRNQIKAELAAQSIRSKVPNASLILEQLDLASLASVRAFAKRVSIAHPQIHLLINNGGVFMVGRSQTEDGFELHFGTNYLAHFTLTLLLLDNIEAAGRASSPQNPARIINVASFGYRIGRIAFDDINLTHNYGRLAANNQGQLAKLYMVQLLGSTLKNNSANMRTYCVHPGVVKTNITAAIRQDFFCGNFWLVAAVLDFLEGIFFRNSSQGAQTTLHCAIDEGSAQETGLYYEDCRPVKIRGPGTDLESAHRLWTMSCELANLPQFTDFCGPKVEKEPYEKGKLLLAK